jgi:hypothetical protein
MAFTCWHCKGTHEHSSEGRQCAQSSGRPRVVAPTDQTKQPSQVTEPEVVVEEAVSNAEQPYRTHGDHNLYVRTGPKIEAWTEASATASGYCDCGHWERFGMPNPTSVVLNWNRHVDEWES